MAHDHSAHSHSHAVTAVNRAFVIGIVLNSVYVIVELAVGWFRSSLALISDAGHNATDVFSLLISLLAFRLLRVKATETFSYGYKKATILVSLFNAVLLIVVVLVIFYEAVIRLYEHVAVPGLTISGVALAGVAVNGISAFLFFKGRKQDVNVRGAYLHLLADALVSLAVVVGGIVIYYTHLYWIDSLLGFIVGIIILQSTWSLLNESIRLALDGTPLAIDPQKIRNVLLEYPEIREVHHMHIWALSSTQNAMTAHVVLADPDMTHFTRVKKRIKHELQHLDIHHVTLEVELEGDGESC